MGDDGVELLGGFAVFIGAFVPLVSVPMTVVLLVAMFTVHLPYGFSSIKLVAVTKNATRAFAPVLTKNQGAVVNILTLVALASMPSLGVYNASKAAAWSLTQSLRADFSKRQVKVFSVFPGAVDTDMLKGVEMPKASPADVAYEVLKGVEADAEDIFPDPMSRQLYAHWATDHKAIERQFAAM